MEMEINTAGSHPYPSDSSAKLIKVSGAVSTLASSAVQTEQTC